MQLTKPKKKHSRERIDSTMKKRVAIFRSELLPLSETFVRAQAETLTHWLPTFIGFEELHGGLDLGTFHRTIVPRGKGIPATFNYWANRPSGELVAQLRCYDLVHAHFGLAAAEIWPSVKSARIPMLVTLHGNDINISRHWWESGAAGLRRRVYPRRLLKMARDRSVQFVAVSAAIRRRAIAYGIPEEKVRIAHIGVDADRFKPNGNALSNRKNQILFVGRMVEKKGPEILIRAFAEARQKVNDATLVMIGDGPLLANAIDTSKRLGVEVSFLGSRSSEEVLAALHASKIFCLPSITASNGDAEGLPISLLEAQACGVPVVTSSQGGLGEAIIPGVTGEAFAEGDVSRLGEHLVKLLLDAKHAEALSRNARKLIELEFDLRKCSYVLEAHYDRCVGLNP